MKKDHFKYILILGIACLAFISIDDVFAKTNMVKLRAEGILEYQDGTTYLNFKTDSSSTMTIAPYVFTNIHGFIPEYDGIPNEYILPANQTTYLHFHFGTNTAINASKLPEYIKRWDVFTNVEAGYFSLSMVYASYTVSGSVLYYDFYVKYSCPGTYSECRAGNTNIYFLDTGPLDRINSPYYIIEPTSRTFAFAPEKYVETLSEMEMNNVLQSANNKEVVDALDRVEGTLNDIKNTGLPDDVKTPPDTSSFDDYESAEGDLMDKVNQADLSGLDIGIDTDSSSFVWSTATKLIQSHPAVFGMFISILSIGIIKLALGR